MGGGRAGLYAAYLLEQRDIHDYVLLEARPTWGGRIASHSPHGLAA
ncbi:NAD(P)-binding protein, partial [Comamonas sp.]